MRTTLIAAAVSLCATAQLSLAESCSDKAHAAVRAQFVNSSGIQVYTDPNTRALPIPATADDATTLVVSGGQSFLFKGPRLGFVFGYKAVGQFAQREMEKSAYDEELRACATPVLVFHSGHRHIVAAAY